MSALCDLVDLAWSDSVKSKLDDECEGGLTHTIVSELILSIIALRSELLPSCGQS